MKGTVAELISTSRGYVVRLTLDGAEVSYDSYKVKYLTDNSSSDYKVVFASPDGSYTDAETVVSGSYIAFTLNSQDAFSLAYVKGDGLSTVAIIVLSAVSGIVVCAIVFGIIIAVSHKRTKKETSDNTEQEENKE